MSKKVELWFVDSVDDGEGSGVDDVDIVVKNVAFVVCLYTCTYCVVWVFMKIIVFVDNNKHKINRGRQPAVACRMLNQGW